MSAIILGDDPPLQPVHSTQAPRWNCAMHPSTTSSIFPTGLHRPSTQLGSPRLTFAESRQGTFTKRSPNETKNAIVDRLRNTNLRKRQNIDRILSQKCTLPPPAKMTIEESDLPPPHSGSIIPRTHAALFLRETALSLQASMHCNGPFFSSFSKYAPAPPRLSARNRRRKALAAIRQFAKLSVSPGLIRKLKLIVPTQPFARKQGFAFLMACRQGDLPQVSALLKRDKWLVLEKDYVGQTGLHWAARRSNVELMSLLLSLGAFIDAKDDLGRSPLSLAATSNSLSAVRSLLSNKANPFFRADKASSSEAIAKLLVRGRLLHLMLPWAPKERRQRVWEREGLEYFATPASTLIKS